MAPASPALNTSTEMFVSSVNRTIVSAEISKLSWVIKRSVTGSSARQALKPTTINKTRNSSADIFFIFHLITSEKLLRRKHLYFFRYGRLRRSGNKFPTAVEHKKSLLIRREGFWLIRNQFLRQHYLDQVQRFAPLCKGISAWLSPSSRDV
jgi:hypothetical protein